MLCECLNDREQGISGESRGFVGLGVDDGRLGGHKEKRNGSEGSRKRRERGRSKAILRVRVGIGCRLSACRATCGSERTLRGERATYVGGQSAPVARHGSGGIPALPRRAT